MASRKRREERERELQLCPLPGRSLVGACLPRLCCCVALESGRERWSTVKEWASGRLGQAECVRL